jgi:anti-sigma factor RsiW
VTHDEAKVLLQLSIDGLLSEPDSQALASHLEDCVECRAEAMSNRSMMDLWRARENVAPPPDLSLRVMVQISAAQPATRRRALAPIFAASGSVLLVLAWFFGGLTASASGVAEGLLNTATSFLTDPMALWNAGLDMPAATLPIAFEALLTAGLGLLLITAAGVLSLPFTSQPRISAEGAR